MKVINGKAASTGIAIANAYVLETQDIKIQKKIINNSEEEIKIFEDAVEKAHKQIKSLKELSLKKFGEDKAAIFDAHLGILLDPEMEKQVKDMINNQNVNSSFAVQEVAEGFKTIFLSMEDEYMKERAADIGDVTSRIIKIIENIEIKDLSLINEPVIIISHDLTPSETSQLNADYVKGFITEIGGRTSHSAIMARSMEIPAITGAGKSIFEATLSEEVLIDGSTGEIILSPSEEIKNEYQQRAEKHTKFLKLQQEFINKESVSADGWKTIIAANIGATADVKSLEKFGADGVGLFRTEFLYMYSKNWPTEEEQFEAYKKVLESSKDDKVVIRTLDIGGDKKLEYFAFPKEENPFLGYRAIRFQMNNTEVMVAQFRALLRASKYGKLAINVPMIATIEEFLKVKEQFTTIESVLKSEGHEVGEYELGLMVEVPAVVELADKFAKHSDFFSIGTNDLIQYTFAADRMSEHVSYLYQPYNPTILRMIKKTIDASHKEGKWTAICGELGSEELLAPVFVGMGLDEFSMSANAIPGIRRIISLIDKKAAEKLVEEVLDMETQLQVEKRLKKFFADNNIDF